MTLAVLYKHLIQNCRPEDSTVTDLDSVESQLCAKKYLWIVPKQSSCTTTRLSIIFPIIVWKFRYNSHLNYDDYHYKEMVT